MRRVVCLLLGHRWGWYFDSPDDGLIAESVQCERCEKFCPYWIPGEPLPSHH